MTRWSLFGCIQRAVAEREGFEPSKEVTPLSGLAILWLETFHGCLGLSAPSPNGVNPGLMGLLTGWDRLGLCAILERSWRAAIKAAARTQRAVDIWKRGAAEDSLLASRDRCDTDSPETLLDTFSVLYFTE